MFLIRGSTTGRELAYVWGTVRTESVVDNALLDFGGEDHEPTMCLSPNGIKLACGLRGEFFHEVGGDLRVVPDPPGGPDV